MIHVPADESPEAKGLVEKLAALQTEDVRANVKL
jgi:hypothetical protein